jgi:hypothetical protein
MVVDHPVVGDREGQLAQSGRAAGHPFLLREQGDEHVAGDGLRALFIEDDEPAS